MKNPSYGAEELFKYDIEPQIPEQIRQFRALAVEDPRSVSEVLRFVEQTSLPLEEYAEGRVAPPPDKLMEALEAEHEARQERKPGRPDENLEDKAVIIRKGRALLVVWGLIMSEHDKDLDYPRPVESEIGRNDHMNGLKRARSAAGAKTSKGVTVNPKGEARAVIKIQAARLAIALGHLSVDKPQDKASREKAA